MRGLGAPGAWVHRVGINFANSYFRKKAAEARARKRLGNRERLERDSGLDPATALTIRRSIAALPRRQRTALILRYYADLPVREVAAAMGCPEGTVKTLTGKAIAALRQDLPPGDLRAARDAYGCPGSPFSFWAYRPYE